MIDSIRFKLFCLFVSGAALVLGCLEPFNLQKNDAGESAASDIGVDTEIDSSDGDTVSDSTGEHDSDGKPDSETADTTTEIETETEIETDTEVKKVIFVNLNSSAESPDGLTWSSAYKHLQEGIETAFLWGGGSEVWQVWVAAGTYGIFESSATDTVALRKNVHVYGGFDGTEESLEDRDLETNTTILDGSGKVYHVVSAEDSAVIDGFTIRGGTANGPAYGQSSGGGVHIAADRTSTIRNCKLVENSARWGGAISAKQNSSRIENCIISGNQAGWGAGLYVNEKDKAAPPFTLSIVNSVFTGNTSTSFFAENGDTGNGGAVYTHTRASDTVSIVNCTFAGNSTEGNGGGICGYDNSSLVVVNSILWANTARGSGSQYYVSETSSMSILFSDIQVDSVDEIQGCTGCTNGDPGLLSTTAPYNVRPTPPSAAIDTGTNINAPGTDIDGNPRPRGDGYDMGAYEYNPD